LDITQLLAFSMQNDASDLHLAPLNPPIIRAHGKMKRIQGDALTSDGIRTMLYSVMTEDQRAEFEAELEIDFAIAFGEKARFRISAFNTRNGMAAVFRTIPSMIPSLEELELPPVMRRFANLEKGLVVITGPTGSGKSTTLAAILDFINTHHAKHIITIEDPIEFFHTSKKSLINHREVGEDTMSFNRALKSALREDPDVIMVGEMRDYETIQLALTASETGHLVFATLHANSAAKTIDRIIDVFPAADKEQVRSMLSGSLEGVVAQNLLKRAEGGRVGCYEILVGTNAVRNLIRENQIAQLYSMIQTGSRYGMMTKEDAVGALIESGVITKQEGASVLFSAGNEETEEERAEVAALGAEKAEEEIVSGSGGSSGEEEGYSF
jgi:twitching motility protein PilT